MKCLQSLLHRRRCSGRTRRHGWAHRRRPERAHRRCRWPGRVGIGSLRGVPTDPPMLRCSDGVPPTSLGGDWRVWAHRRRVRPAPVSIEGSLRVGTRRDPMIRASDAPFLPCSEGVPTGLEVTEEVCSGTKETVSAACTGRHRRIGASEDHGEGVPQRDLPMVTRTQQFAGFLEQPKPTKHLRICRANIGGSDSDVFRDLGSRR